MLQSGRQVLWCEYQNDLGRVPAGHMGNSDEKMKGRHREWIALSLSLSLVHLATISFQEASGSRQINTICFVHT